MGVNLCIYLACEHDEWSRKPVVVKDLQMKIKEPAIVHTFSVINLMFPDDIVLIFPI